jgi:competence protein ComFB
MAETADKQKELDPVNVNEELVRQNVRKVMGELGACQCETCFANACALVLNELKPKYVTSKKGALLSKIDSIDVSSQASLTVEVTKAVMKVMSNPHH